MDKREWPTHMLPTRDPPQNRRPTWTEREGIEKIYFMQMEMKKKKAGVATDI